MLSRAGSLLLTFTGLTVPGGADASLVASVTGLDLDQRSHTKIDPEGKLHGDRPGMKWMLINIAVTAGIAKEADDATQLIIKAIDATAKEKYHCRSRQDCRYVRVGRIHVDSPRTRRCRSKIHRNDNHS